MDYSLFLIVLEVPKLDDQKGDEETKESMYSKGEKYHIINFEDHEQKRKEDELLLRLEELIGLGRFVMFSPSKRFVYLMGLIDYLGKWNMNKRLEMYGKTFLAHFIR